MLTPSDCARAEGCLAGSEDEALCGPVLQPNFNCSWAPNVGLTAWTQLIAPPSFVKSASCIRSSCPISQYAHGIALEFAVLMLTLTYVSSFTLHDVRRLLDRPPPPSLHGVPRGA